MFLANLVQCKNKISLRLSSFSLLNRYLFSSSKQNFMKEFLLVFRRDVTNKDAQPSPEQMQSMMPDWQNWMGSIAAQNKLVNPGNRLSSEGRVVNANAVVTNGPYVEIREAIGGYIIVKADSIDEAAEMSKGCPVLKIGGNVEVRTVVSMDDDNR